MATQATREQLLANESVRQAIAERAYYKAVNEGFVHGRDLTHWYEAETETLAMLDGATINGSAAPKAKTAAKPKALATKTAAAKAPAAKATAAPKAAAKPAAATPAPKRTKKFDA